MKILQQYGDAILAVITTLLAAGHLEHFFSQEWIVLISAIATAVVAFFTAHKPEEHELQQQPKPQGPQPQK